MTRFLKEILHRIIMDKFITAMFAIAYILGIVAVNMGFDGLPMLETPLGVLPTMSFFVGLIFILRDFAQRRLGHIKVIPLMIIGVVITWFTVSQSLALASVCAFVVSETVDWLIYTYTGKKFEDRVLISSAVATPLDTVVFLGMMNLLSAGSFIIMVASKMLITVLLWFIWKKYNIEGYAGQITRARN